MTESLSSQIVQKLINQGLFMGDAIKLQVALTPMPRKRWSSWMKEVAESCGTSPCLTGLYT